MLFFLSPISILAAAAVIPAVVLLYEVYKRDRLEKEPGDLLLSLVLKGIFSTFLAIIAENIGFAVFGRLLPEDSLAYSVLTVYLVVGLSEEGFKYLLLKRATWDHPAFNCRYDGVVYAVFVSLGFALWENLGYVFAFGASTALIRAVTAVPGHACFGVFMGTWYGLAKRQELKGNLAMSRACRFVAVAMPALIHGTYNFIATTENIWIFVLFIAVVFALSFATVNRLSRQDSGLGPENAEDAGGEGIF